MTPVSAPQPARSTLLKGLTAAFLLVAPACSTPPAPAPAPRAPDPVTAPYPPGQLTVTNPRSFPQTGTSLCDLLTAAEQAALVGPGVRREGGVGAPDCELRGDRGTASMDYLSYNVDTESNLEPADLPGRRTTVKGNSGWIRPSAGGCTVAVAVSPSTNANELSLFANGIITCKLVLDAVQILIDRLPATP